MRPFSMTKFFSIYLILLTLFVHCSYQGGEPKSNNLLLLYSTNKDIRLINSTRNNFKAKPLILVKNYTYIAAIDYHFEKKRIFWVDHGQETIFSVVYDGVAAKNKTEIVNNVFNPDGLACDWFTDKIYWTDSETNRIEVATIEGNYRKVLYWTDIEQPRAIAVVPMKGFMFWTDWGESPRIERAGMNGDSKTRKIIVSENIYWPNGLTIDYETETVYWADGKLTFIKRMDYDGNNTQTVVEKNSEYPYALTQFQRKLFWTDWKTMAIHHFDTDGLQKLPTELMVVQHPMDIHVYDQRRQPKQSHPCEIDNAGCSHLCLLSPDPPGYTCACPIGIKLIDEKKCADEPQQLLLLAKRTEICLIFLDSPDYSSRVLPLSEVKYSIDIDFDPVENHIYWSDDEVKKIQRARLDGSGQEDAISEIQHPDGIALDSISRNIYWTDAGTDRIEVARLNQGYRKVVIGDNLVEPRGIAVASELGWLFWSDWYEKDPKVERANLDGSERTRIVTEQLGWPNGITLDVDNFKIYWCDAKANKIEYANMDGTARRVLIGDNVPHAFGLSLMDDALYWTDWQSRTIDRAHKVTGQNREVIVDQMENVMGVRAVKIGRVNGWNPCKEDNGGCSHLCLHRHNKTKVCACQIDYELTKDQKTCVKPKAFLLYAKKDGIGRVSIENEDNEVTIPISGIRQASSIDFDTNTKRIYWSDGKLRTIMKAFINGSDSQRLIDLGLASPEGLAVDWLGLNMFWTDPVAHRIEVSRLVGTSRRTLIWDEANEPHSIALDPVAGYLYWSEWGTTHSIKKAPMNGANVIKLVSTLKPAMGLTLDHDNKNRRLYWVEKDTPAIISTDLDGNDQKSIVTENIYSPIALALYKDFIYWSDNKTGEIFKAKKTDGSNVTKVGSKLDGITDLSIYHDSKRDGSNQCATSNGGCSHLCLALPAESPEEPARYTCACPTHYILQNNECVPPSDFMIYSLRNTVVRLVPDTSECPEAVLPIQGLKAVKAIDFDPKSNFLYWIEGKSHSIKRSDSSGQSHNVVVQSSDELSPYDLAVDAIGRLLFWTCALKDVINVTRLDNSNPFGNIQKREGEKPRLIAVHTEKRLIFYTDVGKNPQLVRTRLDGSHRIVITKASDIAAIAVEKDIIVWAQGHSIYISNIDGENQHVLSNESNSRIIQLTIHSGWLYWIDKELRQLQRIELSSGKSQDTLPVQASHILDLISVKNVTDNGCNLPHQRRCSHFCILNETSPMCACPNGKTLHEDKRTCQTLPDCGSDRFTCSVAGAESKDCIPIAWRCDRQKDCSDGSDELDCPKCLPNQFRCRDGECIDKEKHCDNFPHCRDKSDERNCCETGFQCPQTEVCLALNFVCDEYENCADGSDEKECDGSKSKPITHTIILSLVGVVFVFLLFSFVFLRKRFLPIAENNDQSEDPLSPMQAGLGKNPKLRKGIPDVVRMSMLNDSGCPSTFDRRHVTGASSSSNTNGSSGGGYPRETLNPPPSPATTAASTRGSSPLSRYRPYRHYRSINQPPPPTPCSTDVCDESDYNYPSGGRYDDGPHPPPPTPRSHCHQDSCPPSPSSRSSTYFSPLPPPPSPVASPTGGGYDS